MGVDGGDVFADVEEQNFAQALIAIWLETGRLPHAVLLSGPPGSDKGRLALSIVQALNCGAGNSVACGECSSCVRVAAVAHPDLHILTPVDPPRGSRDVAGEMDQMRVRAIDYIEQHDAVDFGNDKIPREHLDLLRREMSYAVVEGPHKVICIIAAEAMHPSGANSLLKMLEEPPADVFFLLLTAHPKHLLPTIQSRCQTVPLRRLSHATLVSRLEARGITVERAKWAARLGAGSPVRADLAANGKFDNVCGRVERFLSAAVDGDDSTYWRLLEELEVRANQKNLRDFLEICSSYLRDFFLLSNGVEEALTHGNRRDWLSGFLSRLTADQVEAAVWEVDRAWENLSRNANPNLVLVDLWRDLRAWRNEALDGGQD